MTQEAQAALIADIGELIASDTKLQDLPWQSLGMVVTLTEGTREMTGYRYLEDGGFRAYVPGSAGKVVRAARELKAVMAADGDGDFLQCLIHLTRSDHRLRLQFEFADARRWAPRTISLDMSEFANLLRPQ